MKRKMTHPTASMAIILALDHPPLAPDARVKGMRIRVQAMPSRSKPKPEDTSAELVGARPRELTVHAGKVVLGLSPDAVWNSAVNVGGDGANPLSLDFSRKQQDDCRCDGDRDDDAEDSVAPFESVSAC